MLSDAWEQRLHAWSDTALVRVIGATKIPLFAFVGPRVLQNDAQASRLGIPLTWRTRNHLGAMHIGALVCGADLTGALPVLRVMRTRRVWIDASYRELRAEFLRRAEGEVHFRCDAVAAIDEACVEALETGERRTLPVEVIATVPAASPEPVARFALSLSLKRRRAAR